MAYQNVGTPRFYIDRIQYLKSINFDFKSDLENSLWASSYKTALLGETSSFGEGMANSYSRYVSIITFPELFDLDPCKQKFINWSGTASILQSNYNFVLPTGYIGDQVLEGDNIGRYYAILNHNMDKSISFSWNRTQAYAIQTGEMEILGKAEKGVSI